jgi:hypothetical protein
MDNAEKKQPEYSLDSLEVHLKAMRFKEFTPRAGPSPGTIYRRVYYRDVPGMVESVVIESVVSLDEVDVLEDSIIQDEATWKGGKHGKRLLK